MKWCEIERRFNTIILSSREHLEEDCAVGAKLKKENRSMRARAAQGSLFVEAAAVLPVLFAVFFAALEVGNIYFQRHSISAVGYAAANAVQQNPNITADELYSFVKTLAGPSTPFKEIITATGKESTAANCSASECSIDGLTVRVLSSSNKLTKADLLKVRPISGSDPAATVPSNWSNPWLADNNRPQSEIPKPSDPNVARGNWYDNDQNPYYVGVLIQWRLRTVTKLLSSVNTSWQFVSTYARPAPALTWQVMRDAWEGCEVWRTCPLSVGIQGAPCTTLHDRCSSPNGSPLGDPGSWVCGDPKFCQNPPPNHGLCRRMFKCTWN